MKSRWTDQGAREAVQRWGDAYGEPFALRLYTARLIGQESSLVLHGGGNVSLKGTHRTLLGDEVEAIYVKGSGHDLARLDPQGLPGMELAPLRRLRALDALTDDRMINEIRRRLFDASAPTPSVETLVHALLPHVFVDHSHAGAVLAVTNHADGEALVREAAGEKIGIIPYVRPGFELARAVADCIDANPDVEGVVLRHHGLITFGDDARTAYERHIALVSACERFIEKRSAGFSLRGASRGSPSKIQRDEAGKLVSRAAPLLRGLLAWPTGDEDRPYLRSVMEWRAGDDLLAVAEGPKAGELTASGPLTGDHLIHTKPTPLFVEHPSWSDEAKLREQLKEAVAAYRDHYSAYVTAHGGTLGGIDPSPRVVLLPGAGLLCWARSKREARITADIAEHTLITKARAQPLGPYQGLSAEHLYDNEFRGLQRAKVDNGPERPLERQIVVISGGAGAVGSAVAEVCARAGAHVVATDIDERRIERLVERIEERHGRGTALGLVMDVTDEASVRAGFDRIVRSYGGVDVVVPNAGIAHVAPIDEMDVADFRRVMEINATGYLLFMREAIRIMKRQGLGGHIIISASKNVFGPGKDFAAYSASKAAGHQLGKVAAIELAPFGIRVNMINADAIFGDKDSPSGLWAKVGPSRAKSRKLTAEKLPEYYRSRNLLKARVYGHHVGNAVVFFASNATPTTGATLPVDGGLVEAFPR